MATKKKAKKARKPKVKRAKRSTKLMQLKYTVSEELEEIIGTKKASRPEIVQEALENGCSTIVMEDLKSIRERIKAGKKVRSRLHRWSFDQLRQFVEYKAAASGLRVQYVCPAYTSQTCSRCLSLGTRLKHRFSCSNCGSLQHSDLNASQNILGLGLSADRLTGDVNRRHIAAFSGR